MNAFTMILGGIALYWLLNQNKGRDTSRVVTQVSPPNADGSELLPNAFLSELSRDDVYRLFANYLDLQGQNTDAEIEKEVQAFMDSMKAKNITRITGNDVERWFPGITEALMQT